MKVAVIIIVYNLPAEVTILQVEAIRKFCKDPDYEINIVDNSSDSQFAEATRYHCEQLGVKYIKTNASSRGGSESHAFAANLSWQFYKGKYDAHCYFDHDLIPIAPYSVEELISLHPLAGLGQQKQKTYLWQGLVMIRSKDIDKELVDFSPNKEWQLDTGGNLYKLLEKVGLENCSFFNEEYHENPYFNGKYKHYSVLANGIFMHFLASSNWVNMPDHSDRLNSLINIAREKIDASR